MNIVLFSCTLRFQLFTQCRSSDCIGNVLLCPIFFLGNAKQVVVTFVLTSFYLSSDFEIPYLLLHNTKPLIRSQFPVRVDYILSIEYTLASCHFQCPQPFSRCALHHNIVCGALVQDCPIH